MVDALVSNVLQQLATIIQKEIGQEVRLVTGVKKDVKKLSHTFEKIQGVLKDAEERQFNQNSVRLWLQDLKEVAYDIDDVLDEWSTEILKSQIESTRVDHQTHISPAYKKVWPRTLLSPCFCFKRIGLRHDIGHRIKEIKEKLDEIASEKDKFGFVEINRNEIIQESKRRLETSSFVDVSEVFDRDLDKNIIISKLLSEGSQQVVVFGIPVISIVGMGGLGKTTLAQLAFNDDMVKSHFNNRIWIHVSQSFDKLKIAMDIIGEIGGNIVTTTTTSTHGDNNPTWEVVHRQLISCVDGKYFLLVLDDVWNENPMEWDPLRLSLKHGSQGSRIIVTTRNERVASVMGTTYVHKLGFLSDEACWSLMKHYAFVGRQEEDCDKLQQVGMKLAKKCKGLPLSAKTLGSHLHFKKSKQEWQHVLESDVWRVVSTFDKPILPTLLLSYNDLPSHVKQCFAYCSITPRDYTFHRCGMIRSWKAQGFLSDHLATSHDDLITVGEEYFNHLVMRSFFQKDITTSKGIVEFYQMHDLVYDFAKSLVENECFTLGTIKDTNNAQEFDFSRARHLSLSLEGISMIPSFVYKAKKMRSLTAYGGHIPKISSELFTHLTCLRTLDLKSQLEELPNEIEKLIHLRYLDLSTARFKELPITLASLYNLQVLVLQGCYNLCKLPEGIGGLINLTTLVLNDCPQLSYLPEGIGRLSRLCDLSDFIIGGIERGGCKIGELKDLDFLKDRLFITGVGRVENGNEAKMACLKNKQHLRALYFYFDQFPGISLIDDSCCLGDEGEELEEEAKDEGSEGGGEKLEEEGAGGGGEEKEVDGGDTLTRRMEDVLESLQPHPNLEKLIIVDYPGVVFPNWMGSNAAFMIFSNLVFLELRGCNNCKQLPPTLGKLPSLETLVIGQMDKLKFLRVDFFGIDDGATTSDGGGVDTIFPKLRVFMLFRMRNLEEWDMRSVQEEDGKGLVFMPCLQHLLLINLPKLRIFPSHLTQATSLSKLMIWECPNLTWMPSSSSHLSFLHIKELILKKDAGSFSKSLVPNNHMFLPKLKLLRVRRSPYLSLPQGLGKLTSLEILDIRTCSKIESIPEDELHHLTALQNLTIIRCPALRQRCQKEIGEDWSKISHIPNIFIDGDKIK